MLKDIVIKNNSGKIIFVGRFKNIKETIEYCIALRINIEGADLRGADLEGADLRDADLRDVDLRCADLRGSSLIGSNLRGSNLRGSSLRGVDLRYADLEGADLEGADLRDADLRDVDLRGVDLDFTSISLKCTFTKMLVCERYIGQISYHLTRVDYSNCSEEIKEELERIIKGPLGNLFLNYRNDLERV